MGHSGTRRDGNLNDAMTVSFHTVYNLLDTAT